MAFDNEERFRVLYAKGSSLGEDRVGNVLSSDDQVQIFCVQSVESFLDRLEGGVDVVIAHCHALELDELRIIDLVREHCSDVPGSDVPVVIVSEKGSIAQAVSALKRGAADYLTSSEVSGLSAVIREAIAGCQSRTLPPGLASHRSIPCISDGFRLELAYDAGAIGAWNWDIRRDLLRTDLRLAEFLGVDTEGRVAQLCLSEFLATIHDDDRGRIAMMLQQVAATGDKLGAEFRVEGIAGLRWVAVHGRVKQDRNGNNAWVAGALFDITERKLAQLAARERAARYELVTRGACDSIWDWNVKTGRVDYSPRWGELRGLSHEEITGDLSEWHAGIHPDDESRVMAALHDHFEGKTEVFEEEYRVRCKNGLWKWVLDRGVCCQDESGEVTRMAGSESDITDRKRSELAIRQLHEIASNSNAAFDQKVARLLSLGCERFEMELAVLGRLRRKEETGKPFDTFHVSYVGGEGAGLIEPDAEFRLSDTYCGMTVEADTPVALEYVGGSPLVDHPLYRATQLEAYIGAPIHIAQEVVGTLSFMSRKPRQMQFSDAEKDFAQLMAEWIGCEIERHEAERRLQFTQFAVDRTADSIYWVTRDGRFTYVNDSACRSLGYTRDELLRMSVADIDLDYRTDTWSDSWERTKQEGSLILDGRHKTKEGRVIPVEIRTNWLQYKGRELKCAIVRDLTLRRRAEARYRRLMEHASDAIIIADVGSSVIIDANRKAEVLTGWSRQQLLEMHLNELHPGDERHLPWESLLEKKQPEGIVVSECQLADHAGRHIPVEISASVIDIEGEMFIQGMIRNLTERKKAEAILRRAERIASVGTFASGIAHEINNPMSAAWTSAQTARRLIHDPDKCELLDDALQTVIGSVKRCDEIVQNVLRLSRDSRSPKSNSDINEIINRAIRFTQSYAHERRVSVTSSLADNMPVACMNSIEIEQAVINLLRNAIEASQPEKLIHVRSSVGEETVIFAVQDHGRGLSEATAQSIFDPFFTNRPEGEGIGLGMSIVHRIVQDHGGEIDIVSEEGKGATVTVCLPRMEVKHARA